MTDTLKKRINEKTASIARRVYRRGYEITIDTGRVISMDNLEQHVTYAGVLEGFPNKDRNDRHIDWLIGRHSRQDEKPYVLYAPRDIIHIEDTEVRHFNGTSCPQPELLPYITCIARFYSDEPARDTLDSEMSFISLIWFQEEWAMPISLDVMEQLKAFDWEGHAYDGGV